MRGFSVLSLLGVAFLIQVNEAGAIVGAAEQMSSAAEMKQDLQDLARQNKESIAAISAAMTSEHAMQIVQTSFAKDQKFLTMLQEYGLDVKHHKKSLRKGQQAASRNLAPPPSSVGNSQSDYEGGVWAALHKLNDMLLETVEKQDLETIRCESYYRTAEKLMEETREDLASYIILTSAAMADESEASGKITTHKDEGDKVDLEITSFTKEMNTELTSLNNQLTVADGDREVMEKILNMTQCSDKTAATFLTQTKLLQCVNTKTGKSYTKLEVKGDELRKEFSQMRHPKVVSILRDAGIDLDAVHVEPVSLMQKRGMCGCSCHNDTAYEVLFGSDQKNNSCNIKDPTTFSFLDNCCIKPSGVAPCCPAGPPPVPAGGGFGGGGADGFTYGTQVSNTSAKPDPAQQAEKCSLKDSSKCPELRERFLNINGGIQDTITQLKHLIETTEFRKEEGLKLMRAELAHHKSVGDSENEKLLRAMAQLKTLQESKRMKEKLLQTTESEYNLEKEKCRTGLDEMKNEVCALGKIRAQLLDMDALPNNVTDCLTSVWEPEECSVTCGGGTQLLIRTVEIEPNMGYHCPALEVKQSCFEERCPLDCELEDWTGWSACSAMCDGGVLDRIRPVTVYPTAGGTPCETSDDTQDCNTQACDKNCVLHEWTEWTASCTKVCGGGRHTRYKHIKEHEYGEMGTCPEFHDSKRFQWKMCNEQPCAYDDTYPMYCEAPLDVILALDGSGSLGDAGWEAIRYAAANIAGSMGSGVKLGAMVFSSPYMLTEMEVCMGWKDKKHWPEHSDCGVKWAARMTTDTASVKTAIEAYQNDKRGTLTNIAIDYAAVELKNKGRSYAQSVLVILTDGYPESMSRASEAATKFKDVGRVLAVPVGAFADDEYFHNLVTEPFKDNLVTPEDFKALPGRPVLTQLLTDFCPNIVQPIPPTETWKTEFGF